MYVRMENVMFNYKGKEYRHKIGDFFAWAMEEMGLAVPALDFESSSFRFYWTEAGYEKFMSIVKENIEENVLSIRQYKKCHLADIAYEDEYQVAVKVA